MREPPTVHEPARDVPVVSDVDVAVIGAGTAGVMAAVGAARAGARVCVLERSAAPGGAAGAGLIGFYGNFFVDGQRRVIAGAPQEFVERVIAGGGSPLAGFDQALTTGAIGIFINAEQAARVCLQMLTEAGVDLWLHATFAAALPAPGGGCHILFEAKGGRRAIRARQAVDCTGEADVAAALGAPMNVDTARSWGLLFMMANVDVPRYVRFLNDTPADCPEWTGWLARRLGLTEEQLRKDPYWGTWIDGGRCAWRWRREIMKAGDAGDFDLIRDIQGGGQIRYGWDGFCPTPWHGADAVAANVCMITGLDPGDARDVTRAEVAARSYAFDFLAFLRKYVPGFERATIECTGARTIPRGGREIVGECAPLKPPAGPEAICLVRGVPAGLPLGMFIPKGLKDILVAGKCAAGAYSFRASVNCMAMGYSCGILAALAARRGVTPADLPPAGRQTELRRHGVLLEPSAPRADIPPLRWMPLPGVPYADTDEGVDRAKKLS